MGGQKNMEQKETSKTMGILSIVFGFLMPFVGLVLGIIGLSIKKTKGHRDRDITLNVVGIIISIVWWIITFVFWVSVFATM